MSESTRWTAGETAARLGVKPETLYAYVSRGLLTRVRTSDGSTFDPVEVERFAATRRRPAPDRPSVVVRNGRAAAGPQITIDTDVTLIEDDELYYRGRSVIELARTSRFETVCHWLWTGDFDSSVRFEPLPGAVDAVRPVLAAMPPGARLSDRVQGMVPVIAAVDPMREDLTPESIAVRVGGLLATLATGLAATGAPGAGAPTQPDTTRDNASFGDAWIHDQLTTALTGARRASRQLAECVGAALVLLVDHDLAASTMAARTAASARANPYAVILSGLGALDSALHGNASRAAYRMLAAVQAGEDPRAVIAQILTTGRSGVPGFGHRIYRTTDPRAELIFELLADLDGAGPALEAADAITGIVADRGVIFRNVDLALATLALASGMDADAGEVIFSLARIAGWVTHAIDEYQQTPLRLRPIGRYVGP